MAKVKRTQPDDNPIKIEGNKDSNLNISEMSVRMDQKILDPDHDLAVQIPEGIGADHTDVVTRYEEMYTDAKQVEEVFAAGEAPAVTSPDNSVAPVEGGGDSSQV